MSALRKTALMLLSSAGVLLLLLAAYLLQMWLVSSAAEAGDSWLGIVLTFAAFAFLPAVGVGAVMIVASGRSARRASAS